ncbi:MAG: penicillin-binding transpeptidase domain-containing protein, partial [Mariprofundales bacterium]
GIDFVSHPRSARSGQLVVLDEVMLKTWELVADRGVQDFYASNDDPYSLYSRYGLQLDWQPAGLNVYLPQQSKLDIRLNNQVLTAGMHVLANQDLLSINGIYKLRFMQQANGSLDSWRYQYNLDWLLDEQRLQKAAVILLEKNDQGQLHANLTLDDGLQAIVADEARRTQALVRRQDEQDSQRLSVALKSGIGKKVAQLPTLLRMQSKWRTKQQRVAVVLLNEEAEILSAVQLNSATTPSNETQAFVWGDAQFAPGSSFKPVTAMAAIRAATNDDRIAACLSDCTPLYTPRPRTELEDMVISANGHRAINIHLRNHQAKPQLKQLSHLENAVKYSKNIYFAYLGLLLDEQLRLPQPSEIDTRFWTPANSDSYSRTRQWALLDMAQKLGANRRLQLLGNAYTERGNRIKDSLLSPIVARVPLYLVNPHQIAQASIGRSDVRSTPLFGALTALAVGTGKVHSPLLLRTISSDGNIIYTAKQQTAQAWIAADNKYLKSLQDGMYGVVNVTGATAAATFARMHLNKLPFKIHGKTGTATFKSMQVYPPSGIDGDEANNMYLDHAWFIGWVEGQEGKTIAFAATVPESGMGGQLAGDLIRRIVQRIYNEHPVFLGE